MLWPYSPSRFGGWVQGSLRRALAVSRYQDAGLWIVPRASWSTAGSWVVGEDARAELLEERALKASGAVLGTTPSRRRPAPPRRRARRRSQRRIDRRRTPLRRRRPRPPRRTPVAACSTPQLNNRIARTYTTPATQSAPRPLAHPAAPDTLGDRRCYLKRMSVLPSTYLKSMAVRSS